MNIVYAIEILKGIGFGLVNLIGLYGAALQALINGQL